jgi:hypothetical protein
MGILDLSHDLVDICNDFLGDAVFKQQGKSDLNLRGNVLSEPVRWRELTPTGGNVIRAGTKFVWPIESSPRPAIGDIVVSEGIYYTVYRMEQKQHVECWESDCLQLNITNKQWNRCLLLVAEYGKGEANEALAVWKGYYSNQDPPIQEDTISAHFQPFTEDAQIQFGAEFTRESYRVYFEKPIPRTLAGGEFRLVDVDGFRYRIIRYVQEERLDVLPVAHAVRITEGAEYFQSGTPPALLV